MHTGKEKIIFFNARKHLRHLRKWQQVQQSGGTSKMLHIELKRFRRAVRQSTVF